jgi:enoyl-CoA hydratase/carnithine racemase
MNQPAAPGAVAVALAEQILLRGDDDGIATLTLNRPRQYNALSTALLKALQQALDAIARDSSVRVVVIADAGNAFCSGHDLKEMRAQYELNATQALFNQCSEMMLSITRLPQPVIAKVHGIATAAGCQLVAQCDLAVAAQQAKFATSGVNLGLFCSTPSVALSRNLARKQALEMLLTGEFLDAEGALARGLVNKVVPDEALDGAVQSLANAIKSKPFNVIALGKKLFYEQLEMGLADAYAAASKTMACNFLMPEAAQGVDAFLQKRAPKW